MPRETGLEFKVGAFVLTGVVLLLAFVFAVSDFSVFSDGKVYRVVFSYANGLRRNAPVRLAGVDAGHVRDIRAYFDSNEGRVLVEVEAWLPADVPLPGDSRFMVNQLGLMGEKYLEILPGLSTDPVPDGAVFTGDDPVPMESVMRQLSSVGRKAEEVLASVNDGFLNEQNRKALASILSDWALLSGKLSRSEGTFGKFLTDASVFDNLSEMTADLKANPWKLFYRPRGK